MTDLSPCPWCGGAGHVVEDYGCDGRAPLLYRPQCKVCGGGLGGFSKRPEAIAAWNRRAPPASPADAQPKAPASEEFLEFKEALSDLRSLRQENRDLNGGGPGWGARWAAAWAKADELFADEDEAAYDRHIESFYG